jgi:hypothetical protein
VGSVVEWFECVQHVKTNEQAKAACSEKLLSQSHEQADYSFQHASIALEHSLMVMVMMSGWMSAQSGMLCGLSRCAVCTQLMAGIVGQRWATP